MVHLSPARRRSGTFPGEVPTTRFLARVFVAAAVGWALELAWTIRLVPRGLVTLAIALLGTNAALATAGITLATLAAGALDRGWGVRSFWRAARERPRSALAADVALGLGFVLAGAAALVMAVTVAHDRIADNVRTAAFRGPLVGLGALVVAIALAAFGPGLAAPVRARVARARPGTQRAVAATVAVAGLAAAVFALSSIRATVAEIDPPLLLGLAAPAVALAAGWIAGPALSPRLRGRAAAALCVILCAAVLGSAAVLTRRRVLRVGVTTLSLQSRPFAGLAARTATRPAVPAGPATRLFPPERSGTPRAHARHLVLVTIDALRADRAFPPPGSPLARRRLMPNLQALAAGAARFDAAYCTVPGSLRAIPSILTGLYANGLPWRRPSQVMLDARRSRTLTEILSAAGFDTLFVPHTRYVLNPGTSQGFARVIDPVLLPEADRKKKKPRDVAMVTATLAELRRRKASGGLGERRLFLWSHLIDPHAPYWDHGRFGRGEEDRYDAEAAASDRALGMLLAGLEELGLRDEAIVVVTADHGEEFGEHGARRHSRTTWDEAVRVPLVVSVPGAPSRRVREPVSHVDLVPTVLPLLGLAVPEGLDGRSLAPTVLDGTRPPERTIVLVTYPMYDRVPAEYAAVRGRHKLVTDRDGVATGLYDLTADPAERENLLDEAPGALIRALEADVSRYRTRGLGQATR